MQVPVANHIQAPIANKISQLDNEVRDILNGDEPDDIKAKRYAMIIKKFRVPEPTRERVDKIDDAEILESVSPAIRYKAKRLIRIIKEIPELEWNERGELIHRQSTIQGSNIVELFADVLKAKRVGEDRPDGWEEFPEGLATSKDVGRDLIANYSSWKVISERRHPQTPVVPTGRKSRSIRRRVSWEEY
jgi:hypothetical protein